MDAEKVLELWFMSVYQRCLFLYIPNGANDFAAGEQHQRNTMNDKIKL